MLARHLAVVTAILSLVGAVKAAAWESDFASLSRAGANAINPAAPEIIYEIVGQLGTGTGNVEAVAKADDGSPPINLTVTGVSSASYSGGVSSYFSLDATPICDGRTWIVTAKFVRNGAAESAASRIVTCTP